MSTESNILACRLPLRVLLYHFLYILCNLFLNISLYRLDFVFCEGTGNLAALKCVLTAAVVFFNNAGLGIWRKFAVHYTNNFPATVYTALCPDEAIPSGRAV